jgi:hypothetical protein
MSFDPQATTLEDLMEAWRQRGYPLSEFNPSAWYALRAKIEAERAAELAEYNKQLSEYEFKVWLQSFTIAYILVKHSGQIINGIGNMFGFIGSFLGLKMV